VENDEEIVRRDMK